MKTRRPLRDLAYWAPFVLLALTLHAGLWWLSARQAALMLVAEQRALQERPPPAPPEYVRVDVPSMPQPIPPDATAATEPERPRDVDGQIVEIGTPLDERRPDEAQYLAQYDSTVAEETRAPRFAINPEVVAPEFSDAHREASQAGQPGERGTEAPDSEESPERPERFDPLRDGVMGTLPQLADPREVSWAHGNHHGLENPADSESLESALAGAPQNDLLRERTGTGTYLNTKEFLFAEYLLRIRRLVNFYWAQNLDNLPSSVRIAKPEYTTVVRGVLTADGNLERLDVTTESGITVLDECVLRAYRIAGPFPNPPPGLVSEDGRVYLPEMSWTVTFGTADARPAVVDPNADVRFPGLYTNPR